MNPSRFPAARLTGPDEIARDRLDRPVRLARPVRHRRARLARAGSVRDARSRWRTPSVVALAALVPALLGPLAAAPAAAAAAAVDPGATPNVRLGNPFAGADLYVDPVWAARVEAEVARAPEPLAGPMLEVSRLSTAVWIDSFEALSGTLEQRDGAALPGEPRGAGRAEAVPGPVRSPPSGKRTYLGVERHLLEALGQKRDGVPLAITFVVYNLPERDCAARASNGTLAGQTGLATYRQSFIEPIARLFGDPRFAELRIVAILEPDSLPNLVTNLDNPGCTEAVEIYKRGIAHAVGRFASQPNVHTYLDMGHSGWLGWPANRRRAVRLYHDIVASTGSLANVAGVATNVSGYTPAEEVFLDDPRRRVGDEELRTAAFYEYNPMFDERDFAVALEAEFEASGFPARFGVLIDTSRNGWGGPDRPARASRSAELERFVDESRLDRRAARGHWCNQSGAGLGERARAWPYGEDGAVHAFLWIKPPGESDGAASEELAATGSGNKGFDSNCAPEGGDGDIGPSGALAGAPPAGHWFPAQFRELVENAWPRLSGRAGTDAETRPLGDTDDLARTLRARSALKSEP